MKKMHAGRKTIWRFPKIRGTILGVPIIRIIIFWDLNWGTLIWGNYHILGPYITILGVGCGGRHFMFRMGGFTWIWADVMGLRCMGLQKACDDQVLGLKKIHS